MDLAATAEPRQSEDSLRSAPGPGETHVENQEEENKFQKAIAAWRSMIYVEWKISSANFAA